MQEKLKNHVISTKNLNICPKIPKIPEESRKFPEIPRKLHNATKYPQDNFRRLHNACCESRKTNSVVLRFSLDEFCSARRFSQDDFRGLHNACCESRRTTFVGYIMRAASLALQNSSSENCWRTFGAHPARRLAAEMYVPRETRIVSLIFEAH